MRRDEVIIISGSSRTEPSRHQRRQATTSFEPKPRALAARRELAVIARGTGRAGPQHALIEIKGDINDATAKSAKRTLKGAPHASSIRVLINSHGGSVYAALEIYAAIRAHPAERKSAVVLGCCESAAVLPLLAADHRAAHAHSRLLIHSAAIEPHRGSERWTSDRHAMAADRIKEADAEMLAIIVARTGLSRSSCEAEMCTEEPMPPVKAVYSGILHEVEGITRRCTADWPKLLASAMRDGTVFGMPAYMESAQYFAACQAAPTRRTDR